MKKHLEENRKRQTFNKYPESLKLPSSPPHKTRIRTRLKGCVKKKLKQKRRSYNASFNFTTNIIQLINSKIKKYYYLVIVAYRSIFTYKLLVLLSKQISCFCFFSMSFVEYKKELLHNYILISIILGQFSCCQFSFCE